MDAYTLTEWTAALRSGQYKKGTSIAFDPKTGCYCALGVLAKTKGFAFLPSGYLTADAWYAVESIVYPLTLPTVWSENDSNPNMSFPELADFLEEAYAYEVAA